MSKFFKYVKWTWTISYWKRQFFYYWFQRLYLPKRETRFYTMKRYDGSLNDYVEFELMVCIAKLGLANKEDWSQWGHFDEEYL